MRVCHSRIKRSLVKAVHPGRAGQPDTMEEAIMGSQGSSETRSVTHVSDNTSAARGPFIETCSLYQTTPSSLCPVPNQPFGFCGR